MSAAWKAVVGQFGNPHGPLGHLVGMVMRHRGSNRQRTERTVELLALRPDSRVLELGFGPGVGVACASAAASRGAVFGVDRSAVMVAQARRLNRRAIAQGCVDLRHGDATRLDEDIRDLDAAFAINVAAFWDAPVDVLRALHGRLRSGGVVALTQQPRKPKATEDDTNAFAERMRGWFADAGYVELAAHRLDLQPVPGVCVIGRRA